MTSKNEEESVSPKENDKNPFLLCMQISLRLQFIISLFCIDYSAHILFYIDNMPYKVSL